MNVSLYQAAAALNANSRWQELISENLASSSIPGYKKQDISFAAIQAGLVVNQSPSAADALPAFPKPQAAVNFQSGEIKPTGVNTDVAIEGPGFFEVQLPNGSRAYTRDGEFQLNAQGQLVTKQGYLVMSDSGPLQIDLNNRAPLSISSTGEVAQGRDLKGILKVTDFTDLKRLTPLGGGLFSATNPAVQEVPLKEVRVRQGCLEGSNTSAVLEMANLISAMRLYEANQRVVQMQDDRMGKAISELAGAN
jgi:flagellar basal-body rod protein FlgF